MATVEVRSRVIGAGSGEGLGSVFFDPGSERLTVRTLILRAVEEQVRDLTARRDLSQQEAQRQFARQYQTEAEIVALREQQGRTKFPVRGGTAPRIDLGRAQQQALDAFTSGRCLVYVGDRQLESLDQEIDLGVETKIQFIRLLPLRGGC